MTSVLPLRLMLAHIHEIVEATLLPVNANSQSGYADEPEEFATNVKLRIGPGVTGLSIEENSVRGARRSIPQKFRSY